MAADTTYRGGMMRFLAIFAAICVALMLLGIVVSMLKFLFMIGLIAFVVAGAVSLAGKVTGRRSRTY